MVKAKFFAKGKTYLQHSPNSQEHAKENQTCEVEMTPVFGQGNEEWSRHTPSGDIKMLITNPAAHAHFEIGEEYVVTFVKA